MISFEKSNFSDRDKYEAYKKRQKDGDRRRAKEYINSLMKPCLFCGSDDDIHFHHVNPNEKKSEVVTIRTKTAIREEVVKCWCLCRNCHQALHMRLCDPLPTTYDIRLTVH